MSLKPTTADQLLMMLESGNKNRTQHPTDANAESSRSHAVFQVTYCGVGCDDNLAYLLVLARSTFFSQSVDSTDSNMYSSICG